MNFKKSIITAALVLLTCRLYAEYVFLGDGAIIQGKIISDTAISIVITDKDNKRQIIPRENIMRILYTDLYLGKIYVQKIDGKNEICYMVDEDRDTYTFRKELYSPEEFTLRRDQVLFIARGNPTGLEGEAGTDTLDLKWYPPYNPVKRYRLFVKTADENEFKVAGETKNKSYRLKDLKSNTKYILYVSAIDASGDESLPSNELTITTLNIKPGRPEKLRYVMRDSDTKQAVNGKKEEVSVTGKYIAWDPVFDEDGTISGYNIYYLKDGKEEKIASVKDSEYKIPEDKSVYDLRITAIDDRNDESPASRIRHPRAVKGCIQPVYFIPFGRLGEMFDPGFGWCAYIGEKNFYMQNLELGISLNAVNLPGRDKDRIEDMLLVPVTVDGGYHFTITEYFTVMPFASMGYAYMDVNYIFLYDKCNKKKWEPLARAGVMVNFEFEYLQVSAGTDCGFIYETSVVKPFFELFIRAGVLIDM